MPLLEFQDVGYSIAGRDVLRGLNLSIEEGETIVLLGRSGSGKTTILRCVNRLIEPSRGAILFKGVELQKWEPIRLRRNTGYVIQDAGLLPHMTVAQNVGIVPRLEQWPQEKIAARVSELLDAVGLSPARYSQRYPRQLSGGERQRVGVARALAADPPLLLLDEPFGALDPITRYDLQRLFLQLRREYNKTAIFVTHDIREALLIATRVALLHQGQMEVLATPAEFLNARTPEAGAFLASLEHEWRPS